MAKKQLLAKNVLPAFPGMIVIIVQRGIGEWGGHHAAI
jgi:hypothetical protein